MKKIYPAKDPDERLTYGFNWSPRNIGIERINLITASVISGSVIIPQTTVEDVPNARDGQGTTFIATGGVDGETCEIKLHAETAEGSIMEQTVYLPIRQK